MNATRRPSSSCANTCGGRRCEAITRGRRWPTNGWGGSTRARETKRPRKRNTKPLWDWTRKARRRMKRSSELKRIEEENAGQLPRRSAARVRAAFEQAAGDVDVAGGDHRERFDCAGGYGGVDEPKVRDIADRERGIKPGVGGTTPHAESGRAVEQRAYAGGHECSQSVDPGCDGSGRQSRTAHEGGGGRQRVSSQSDWSNRGLSADPAADHRARPVL